MDNNILKFTDVRPSLKPGEEISGYKKQILEYSFRGSMDQLWDHYLSTTARKVWDCGRITLNLLFSGKDESLFYNDNAEEYLEPNQLVFLTLNFLNGIVRLPMSFIITSIDRETNTIEFSYITGNTAHGKQQLVFLETKKGNARIEHISYFKSNSFIRDRILYPYFHKKVTNSFHRNMWKRLKNNSSLRLN